MSICIKISEIQAAQAEAFKICQNSQNETEKMDAVFKLSNSAARALIALNLAGYDIKINSKIPVAEIPLDAVFIGQRSELATFYEYTMAVTARAINHLRRLDQVEHDVLINTYKIFPKIPEIIEAP